VLKKSEEFGELIELTKVMIIIIVIILEGLMFIIIQGL